MNENDRSMFKNNNLKFEFGDTKAQSVCLLATGWSVRGSNSGGRGRCFAPV
jgi:hypothetical protein